MKVGQSGVLDDSEIQEILTVGSPHWDDFVDAVTKVAEQNGIARAMLVTPRDNGTLEKLKDATSGMYLTPPKSVSDLRRFVTNQLPNAAGTTQALVGNLTSAFVVLGVRNQWSIEVTRTGGDAFEKYGVKVRVVGRYDVNVGRPKHLVALRGLTA